MEVQYCTWSYCTLGYEFSFSLLKENPHSRLPTRYYFARHSTLSLTVCHLGSGKEEEREERE
jgi:hypothetical protein